jgi:uracil-DNA glycosylase family 4
MLKVDCTYEKQGIKIHHIHAETNFVPPIMGPSLRIVIAEAAGETEEQKMAPLVGAAGKFFDSLLRKAGIQRDQLTLINCMNCRPPNNKFPTDGDARFYISEADAELAVKQCIRNHVLAVLESRPWTRVDLLGAKALKWFLGLSSIEKWRGSPLDIDTEEVRKRVG